MAACVKCGAALNEGAVFCGSCGTPVAAAGPAPSSGGAAPGGAPGAASSGGLTSNVAGALAYFTIIPAILFIVMDPYNKDRFIRFHAFQSLFFQIALLICWVPVWIVGWIPIIGWLILILGILVLGLGGFIVWIFLVFKAYNNLKFELPVIGKMAAEQAAK